MFVIKLPVTTAIVENCLLASTVKIVCTPVGAYERSGSVIYSLRFECFECFYFHSAFAATQEIFKSLATYSISFLLSFYCNWPDSYWSSIEIAETLQEKSYYQCSALHC